MAKRIALGVFLFVVMCWVASYWCIGTNQPMGDLSRWQLVDGALVYLTRPIAPGRILFNGSDHFVGTLWWTDWSFTGASMTVAGTTTHVIVVPLWMPLLFAGGAYAIMRRAKYSSWSCQKCGYDLRGADHQVCPECGTTCMLSAGRDPIRT